jgi:putative ABC transport system permease protein
MSTGITGSILVTWPLATTSFLLAVGATIVASAYPAWKASRMNIVDALRHNR